MELRLAVIFGFCFIASLQIVEGSGSLTSVRRTFNGVEHEYAGSGFPVDDEDGDVVEGGSGLPDELEGSGGYIHANVSVVTHPVIHLVTTTLPPDGGHDLNRRPLEGHGHGVEGSSEEGGDGYKHPVQGPGGHPGFHIEDSSTMHTTPLLKTAPSEPPGTSRTQPPPTVFETDHNARFAAFFKPGILAAVIGGFVVGILAAILIVMFIVYRMRKKDEGSYALDEQKQPALYPNYTYQKAPTKEFYA